MYFVLTFLYLAIQVPPGDYKGTPYDDIMYHAGPQTIPGKLQCEYYDFGGNGITGTNW